MHRGHSLYTAYIHVFQMRADMGILSAGLSEGERLVVSPRRARHMLDIGNTRLYELLQANELTSYLDGRSRKIVVSSIYQLIARRLAVGKIPPAKATLRRGRGRLHKHRASGASA